jgi:hypothetical protein
VTVLFRWDGKGKFGMDRCMTGMVAQGCLVAIVAEGLRRIEVGFGS